MSVQWLDIRSTTERFIWLELNLYTKMQTIHNEQQRVESLIEGQDSPARQVEIAALHDKINRLHTDHNSLLTDLEDLRTFITGKAEIFQPDSWIDVTCSFDLYALAYIAAWEAKHGFQYFRVSGNDKELSPVNELSHDNNLMTLADNIKSEPFDPTKLYRIKKHADGVVKVELEEDEEIRRTLTPGMTMRPCTSATGMSKKSGTSTSASGGARMPKIRQGDESGTSAIGMSKIRKAG